MVCCLLQYYQHCFQTTLKPWVSLFLGSIRLTTTHRCHDFAVCHDHQLFLCVQREVSLLQKAAADAGADPAVAKLQQQVAQQRESLATLDSRVNDIRDRMFAGFR
jgi:hypothetical protein